MTADGSGGTGGADDGTGGSGGTGGADDGTGGNDGPDGPDVDDGADGPGGADEADDRNDRPDESDAEDEVDGTDAEDEAHDADEFESVPGTDGWTGDTGWGGGDWMDDADDADEGADAPDGTGGADEAAGTDPISATDDFESVVGTDGWTGETDGDDDGGDETDETDTVEVSASVADGGAYDVDQVDPYSGPGETPTGPTPGAPDDEEMPLADHVEEMVRRLAVVVVVGGLVTAVVFPFADRLINFLWYSFLPGSTSVCPPPVVTDPTASGSSTGSEAACPYVYHPLALMFARIKVASLVGFIAALPVIVYESYLFMRPGLYPRERRYYLASVPTSLVLAGVGVAFAYFLVLPTLFLYFTGYTDQAAEIAFGLTETFNLIVMMLGFFALVFQIPLLIMLAVLMGVTSRRWLAARRLYFYGGFATVAFLFSPDPTGMAPILVAVTMIVLFEGTLLILRWTLESSPVPSAEGLADRRPAVYLLALLAGYLTSTAPVPGGYYGSLPAVVRDGLASLGLTRATPLVVGLGLVAVYELVAYWTRRTGAGPRVRRALSRGRALAWPLALVVGYFGSPDPVLLARVEALAFGPARVAAVVVGLVVVYELAVRALARREASS